MTRRLVALVLAAACAAALGCAQLGLGAKPEPAGLSGILARGELRVGMTGEQPPLNMTTRTGELVGLEVALARVLASLIDVRARFVRMPFEELLDALERGEIDLAMSGIGITPHRNLRVAFVGPYFVSGKSLLSRSEELLAIEAPGELNRPELRIAALAGSTSEDYVRRHLPKARLVPSRSLDAAVQLVVHDEVDALLADLETCHFAALRYAGTGMRSLEKTFTTEPIGIALPPENTHLANLLENYLEALERQGAIARALDYWFENDDWLESLR